MFASAIASVVIRSRDFISSLFLMPNSRISDVLLLGFATVTPTCPIANLTRDRPRLVAAARGVLDGVGSAQFSFKALILVNGQ